MQRLASTYSLPVETLQQAAHSVLVIPETADRVETWPAAQHVRTSILNERIMFTNVCSRS